MLTNIVVINEEDPRNQVGLVRQARQVTVENSKGRHPSLAEIYQRPETQRENIRKSSLSRRPPNNPLKEQLERARQKRENVDEPNLFLNRPGFLKRVFCHSFIFSILALLTLMGYAKFIKIWDGIFIKVSIAAGCVALIAFLLIVVFLKLRQLFPINWILALSIIEGSCTVVALVNKSHNYKDLTVTYVVAVAVGTFLVLMSFCINRKLLPGDWLFTIVICTLIGTSCLYILLYYMDKLLAHTNFIAVLLACTIVITLYHGELVCGLRIALFRKNHLYYSILIYLDFLAFYMISYHIIYVGCNK